MDKERSFLCMLGVHSKTEERGPCIEREVCLKCGKEFSKTESHGSVVVEEIGSCIKREVCSECEKELKRIESHKWGEWVVTVEGDDYFCPARERKCEVCGEVQKEERRKHRWGSQPVDHIQWDYDHDYYVYRCESCGEIATDLAILWADYEHEQSRSG